jgi:hypothetical protein
VCLYVFPLLLLGNCSAETSLRLLTQATVEELLDALFSMGSISYGVEKAISSSKKFLLKTRTIISSKLCYEFASENASRDRAYFVS